MKKIILASLLAASVSATAFAANPGLGKVVDTKVSASETILKLTVDRALPGFTLYLPKKVAKNVTGDVENVLKALGADKVAVEKTTTQGNITRTSYKVSLGEKYVQCYTVESAAMNAGKITALTCGSNLETASTTLQGDLSAAVNSFCTSVSTSSS